MEAIAPIAGAPAAALATRPASLADLFLAQLKALFVGEPQMSGVRGSAPAALEQSEPGRAAQTERDVHDGRREEELVGKKHQREQAAADDDRAGNTAPGA